MRMGGGADTDLHVIRGQWTKQQLFKHMVKLKYTRFSVVKAKQDI